MNKTLSLPELRDILVNLHDPIDQLIGDALDFEQRAQILERGYFRPQEDEDLAYWLARYLSVRTELLGIVCSVDSRASVPFRKISTLEHWRCFVLGYTAACQLVRLDRYFLWEFATHKLIQRKLNEAYPEYRIPPKTYTNVFQHFTDPSLAFRLYEAIWFARLFSWRLRFLRKDPVVGEFVSRRKEFEEYLDKSKRNYLKRTALFFRHSFRRRFASAKQKTLFGILERLGRTASEINIDSPKYINSEIKRELSEILEPGDILVTRHRYALTNLFLPGYWPHAALYIGTPKQREELEISVNHSILEKWTSGISTMEALKDGVKLRPLVETLEVDACVVLRPMLSKQGIRTGIERIVKHEGKRYNFDFDFFRSDCLVCTEVVYRAFDGVEGLEFVLSERAGRKSVSAEDFLDMALEGELLHVVAMYGYPLKSSEILTGERARELLAESYKS